MHHKVFTFNPFMENTYVLYDASGSAIIIDPGCSNASERKQLEDFIIQESLKPTGIYNTHCHIDHVLGNAWVAERWKLPLFIHATELPYLRAVPTYAPNYGFSNYTALEPTGFFKEGDSIQVGEESLSIRFAPGHSAGHVVFYHASDAFCIVGDVIFKESIGRTDLPGGDYDTLIQSIRSEIFTLPAETTLYPGHGDPTTVSHEMKYNPFCGQASQHLH